MKSSIQLFLALVLGACIMYGINSCDSGTEGRMPCDSTITIESLDADLILNTTADSLRDLYLALVGTADTNIRVGTFITAINARYLLEQGVDTIFTRITFKLGSPGLITADYCGTVPLKPDVILECRTTIPTCPNICHPPM